LKTFIWSAILITVVSGVIPYLKGEKVRLMDVVGLVILLSSIAGVGAAVMFTPRRILWNENRFGVVPLIGKEREFEWTRLEAWSPFGDGTFSLKFNGEPTIQIGNSGLSVGELAALQAFLREHFAEREAKFSIGARPIVFRKGSTKH
jgi:hypothetical protein